MKGFTIIELMIVVAIIGIIAAVALPNFFPTLDSKGRRSTTTWGAGGVVEERCIGGYLHTVSGTSGARQVMDEFGKGVKC